MRVYCSNCEAPFFTTTANCERYTTMLCRMCRREEHVEESEVPHARLYGQELEMGRWFGGVIPKKYTLQGRHHNGEPRR